MIISDGVTDLTFSGTQFDDFAPIEQSSTRTAGGSTRTIRSGKRFACTENILITGAEYEELNDLLLNGANDYYYTPTVTPDYLDSTDFPMAVQIEAPEKIRHSSNGVKMYHVTLKIIGSDYL
jgi:hypothetical protein